MDLHDGRVVSNFIFQALTGKPLTVYGDGSQTRSFCFVSDLVDGLVRLSKSREGFTGPVNLGNPNEFTMIQLAEKVIELTNSNSNLVFESLPGDDPKLRQPDISIARSELGWEPMIQLAEGLKKTISDFEARL
jgi:UDP-glucuronate decarboxylase